MLAIAAMSPNRIIGDRGGLPWSRMAADLQWFRKMTLGRDVVFGRKTFQELPVLLGRRVWVLGGGFYTNINGSNYPHRYVYDIDALPKDCVVAGGAKVYAALLPYCDELYLTLMNQEYEGDTEMPPFEHLFSKVETIEGCSEFEIRKYSK